MIVLGIDTATSLVSVALVDGDKVLASSESLAERRHAEDLTPMLDFVVRTAGIGFTEIDAIAVDVGPGQFTGMRVGIAAAQALAHVLAVRLVGVDGLDALAATVPPTSGASHDIVVPTIDARRSEVAWAIHRRRENLRAVRVDPPTIGTMEDLTVAIRERAQSCLFIGGFALDHRAELRDALGPQSWEVSFGEASTAHPHARSIALLAHERLLHDEKDETVGGLPPRAEALYLREADAEINWPTRNRA